MHINNVHIAGVVNPPKPRKYGYWTNSSKTATPEEWLENAERHEGSWWPDWQRWSSRKSGRKIEARRPGAGKLEPIEDAPGSYVETASG